MKKTMLAGAVLVLALVIGMPGLYAQQQTTAPGGSGWYCPWMGQGGGMHHGMQRGMGCCMMGGPGGMSYNKGQPVTKEQAKQLLENYVGSKNSPNLKLGEIVDKGEAFEATIVTKDGALVEKIQVDKNSGWFRNVS